MNNTVFKIIDKFTEGVDTYHNNGSMWLIFTDEKKWVIELSKEGTLWYNYYFFQDCFKYVSLDVVENQNYITEWVVNLIQNGVKNTSALPRADEWSVDDAIQNGVKETKHNMFEDGLAMEETIQKGVKEIRNKELSKSQVNRIVKNGVKEIKRLKDENRPQIGNIIKQTNWRKVEHFPDYTDRITKKGVGD